MIRAFLIEHIDSLIPTIGGLVCVAVFRREREKLTKSAHPLVQRAPALAWLLVAFGIGRFAIETAFPFSWHRVSVLGGRVSAEFPRSTHEETAQATPQGVSLNRTVVRCEVPSRQIVLDLVYNEIPEAYLGLTLDQRLEGMTAGMAQAGFVVDSLRTEESTGVRMFVGTMSNPQTSTHCRMRGAVIGNHLCWVSSTSSGGYDDDPLITRFVDSFQAR